MNKIKTHQNIFAKKSTDKKATADATRPSNSDTTNPEDLAGISITDAISPSDLMKSHSNRKPTKDTLDAATPNTDDAQPDNTNAQPRPQQFKSSTPQLEGIFGKPFVKSSNAEVTMLRIPTSCPHLDCQATLHLKQSIDGFTYCQSEEDRVEIELKCRNGHRSVAYFVEAQRRAMLTFALVADGTSSKRIK